MPLEKVNRNSNIYLKGVYTGQKNQLVDLGPKDSSYGPLTQSLDELSFLFSGRSSLTYYVGIDKKKRPAILRVYVDPGQLHMRYSKLGIALVCNLTYDGTPIPPGVYREDLEKIYPSDPEKMRKSFENYYPWFDMKPNLVKEKKFPFYPLNSSEPPYEDKPFFKYPQPNGCLTQNIDTYELKRNGASLCASLIAPVHLDMDILNPAVLEAILADMTKDDFVKPLVDIPLELNRDIIQTAINQLKKVEEEFKDEEETSPLMQVQWIGSYALIEVTFKTYSKQTYCAFLDEKSKHVKVFYMDGDRIDRLKTDTAVGLLDRLVSAKKEQRLIVSEKNPKENALSLHYQAIVYGIREDMITLNLGGIEISANWTFDEMNEKWTPLKMSNPVLIRPSSGGGGIKRTYSPWDKEIKQAEKRVKRNNYNELNEIEAIEVYRHFPDIPVSTDDEDYIMESQPTEIDSDSIEEKKIVITIPENWVPFIYQNNSMVDDPIEEDTD